MLQERFCKLHFTDEQFIRQDRIMHEDKLFIYAQNQRSCNSPREVEAEALTLGASKLIFCMNNWTLEARPALLSEALRFNQRLWLIFQVSLGSKENLLPKDLRLDLLKISAFVDKQIFAIMAFPEPEKLKPIININLNLAQGLRSKFHRMSVPASAQENAWPSMKITI